MITLILAAVLAQPCLLPPAHHHKPAPVASCVAPLPAALAQPEPEPVEFAVYRYYETPGMCYDDVPRETAVNGPGAVIPSEGPPYYQPGYALPLYPAIIVLIPPVSGHPLDPPVVTPPVITSGPLPPPMVTKAPEIDAGGGLVACTFLAGALVVMRGRRR